jgi:hypothetical protein
MRYSIVMYLVRRHSNWTPRSERQIEPNSPHKRPYRDALLSITVCIPRQLKPSSNRALQLCQGQFPTRVDRTVHRVSTFKLGWPSSRPPDPSIQDPPRCQVSALVQAPTMRYRSMLGWCLELLLLPRKPCRPSNSCSDSCVINCVEWSGCACAYACARPAIVPTVLVLTRNPRRWLHRPT